MVTTRAWTLWGWGWAKIFYVQHTFAFFAHYNHQRDEPSLGVAQVAVRVRCLLVMAHQGLPIAIKTFFRDAPLRVSIEHVSHFFSPGKNCFQNNSRLSLAFREILVKQLYSVAMHLLRWLDHGYHANKSKNIIKFDHRLLQLRTPFAAQSYGQEWHN